MSDWDASEGEEEVKSKIPAPAPKAAIKKKWADEDEDENNDVVSDWEASEEEKPAPKTVQTHAAPAKKKKSLKERLAEKEAARLANGDDSPDTEDDLLDPALKKRIERERELEADMKNASDLFGATSIGSTPKDLADLLKANPKTKDEFVDFSNRIMEIVIKRVQNKPLYNQFVEHHIRQLATPMKDVEVRKAASVLTTLANEKQKEQREGGKKKKPGKPALGAVKAGRADTKVYDEALDDFGNEPDDFM